MKKEEIIKTVLDLLDATKELNGEFQEGWEKEIEKGEELLVQLKQEQPSEEEKCPKCESKNIAQIMHACFRCVDCSWTFNP